MTPGKVIHNRGTVSVQMTAQDIISLAVNVVQNGRSLDDLGYGSAEDPLTLRQMLAEVYDHILTTNRQAASRLPHKGLARDELSVFVDIKGDVEDNLRKTDRRGDGEEYR